MIKYWWLSLGIIAIALIWLAYRPEATSINNQLSPADQSATEPASQSELQIPIDGFFERITEKPFGIYITPVTSPVQPEKFTGYHTGVDVEYGEVESEVAVRAVADGKVAAARTAAGYGGVLVIDHRPDYPWFSLYGHLDPGSLPRLGATVLAGQAVGKLAPAFSTASGGERKHLHFGIIAKSAPDIAGYVATERELAGWLDPQLILPK